ncbi:MAG: tetratricopeptide repeat protein [Phycisphaerae bacterium]
MVAIRAITSLRANGPVPPAPLIGGKPNSGTVDLVGGRRTGGASQSAFVLGGGGEDFAAGLYNVLGAKLSPQAGALEAADAALAESQRVRAQTLGEAAALIDNGDTDTGRALVAGFLEADPTDVAALRVMASADRAEGNLQAAERTFEKIVALAPHDAQARSDLNNARVLQRPDAEVLSLAKRKIQQDGQRADGIGLLVQLAARNPDNAEVFLALAEGFRAARKPKSEIGAVQEAIRTAGPGEIDRVIAEAQSLVDQLGNLGLTHNLLGRALDKSGRTERGIRELAKAVDIAPANAAYRFDLADAHITRAEGLLDSGQLLAAEGALHEARGLAPYSSRLGEAGSRVALERARNAVSGGRFNAALPDLKVAARNAPADEPFRKDLATQFLNTGSHFDAAGADTTALDAFAKALDFNPELALARTKVGQLADKIGLAARDSLDYDRAIGFLEQAFKADRSVASYGQDLAGVYDLRGRQSLARGKVSDAIADFKRGLEIDPTNASLGVGLALANA